MGDSEVSPRNRWWALIILSLGALMINLDATIVIVALPQISLDLHFSDATSVWVLNVYLLTFAGFLLLGGRLGDLFGRRRMFLIGVALFTIASLGCGLSSSPGLLLFTRATQGLGGAIVGAVSLSLALELFTEQRERAKAVGIFGFVRTGGGSIALLLGGTLTAALSWHWIFLINVPIGLSVCVVGFFMIPKESHRIKSARLDVAGAVTVTTSLMIATYAIVTPSTSEQPIAEMFGLLGAASVLLCVFIAIERRVHAPLVPLELFRQSNLVIANIIYAMLIGPMMAWYCIITLYLEAVLKYGPLQVGMAFLPSNQISAAFALGLSRVLVVRLGFRPTITAGLLLTAGGFALCATMPAGATFSGDILGAMCLTSLGSGMVSTPLLLAATSGIAPGLSGFVSGFVGTTTTMGGALGVAVLVSIAAVRTKGLVSSGSNALIALNSGYHTAFMVGSGVLIAAAMLSFILLRDAEQDSSRESAQSDTA